MPNLVGLVDNPYDDFALEDGMNIKLFDESSLIFERNNPFSDKGVETPYTALNRMEQLAESRGKYAMESEVMMGVGRYLGLPTELQEKVDRENPVLTEEQFNEQFKDSGIKYEEGMRQKEAGLLTKWKEEEREYEQKMSLVEKGEPIQSFLAGLAGQSMDPINLMLAIPTLGQGGAILGAGSKALAKVGAAGLSKKVAGLAATKNLTKSVALGMAENTIFNLPAEGLVANSMVETQANEELYSFWENMVFATILGGAMHGAGYGVRKYGTQIRDSLKYSTDDVIRRKARVNQIEIDKATDVDNVRFADVAEHNQINQAMIQAEIMQHYNRMMDAGTIDRAASPFNLTTPEGRQHYINTSKAIEEVYDEVDLAYEKALKTYRASVEKAPEDFKPFNSVKERIKATKDMINTLSKNLEEASPTERAKIQEDIDFFKDATAMMEGTRTPEGRQRIINRAFESPEQAAKRARKGQVPFTEEVEYKSQAIDSEDAARWNDEFNEEFDANVIDDTGDYYDNAWRDYVDNVERDVQNLEDIPDDLFGRARPGGDTPKMRTEAQFERGIDIGIADVEAKLRASDVDEGLVDNIINTMKEKKMDAIQDAAEADANRMRAKAYNEIIKKKALSVEELERWYVNDKPADAPDVTKLPEYESLKAYGRDIPKVLDEIKICARGKGDFDLNCLDMAIKKWTRKYPEQDIIGLTDAVLKDIETGGVDGAIKAEGGRFEAAFQQVLEDAAEANIFALRTTLIQSLKFDQAWKRITKIAGEDAKGKQRSLGEALGALLVGDYFGATGVRNSVDARKRAMSDSFHGTLFNQLKREGLWKQFNGKTEAYQKSIVRELWDLQSKSGPEEIIPKNRKRFEIEPNDSDALKTAKIIYNIQDEIIRRQNLLGAHIKPLDNYVLRQSHSAEKIAGRGFMKRARQAISDASEGSVPKDTTRTLHQRARKAWVDEMMNRLDLGKTFPRLSFNKLAVITGEAPIKFPEGFEGKTLSEMDELSKKGVADTEMLKSQINIVRDRLGNIFEDLSRGTHNNAYIDISAHTGVGVNRNIAASLNSHRVFHFKSADDWFAYNNKYGAGDINNVLSTAFDRAGENIALMETLGPVPEDTFNALKARIKAASNRGFDIKDLDLTQKEKILKVLKEEGLEKYSEAIERPRAEIEAEAKKDTFINREKFGEFMLDSFFAEVSGATRMPSSRISAKVSSGIRAMNVLTKLGGAAVSALADAPIISRETARQGATFMESFTRPIQNIFEYATSSKERKAIAESLGIGISSIRNNMLSRLTAVDANTPQRLRSLQNQLFRWTGMESWNDAHKSGMAMWTSNRLGNMADKKWGELTGKSEMAMKSLLDMYGIGEAKWDLMRKTIVPVDGAKYMDPSAVRNLTDEDVIKYLDDVGAANKDPRRIQEIKDELELDIQTFINDRVDFGVITPGAREAAFMNFGTAPGTPEGEIARFLMQFKSFPITVMSKIIGGDLKREGFTLSGMSKMAGMMTGMLAMGYVAMSIKDLSRGRNPRPLFNEDGVHMDNFMAAALQSGALGIFGDLIFGPETRYGHSAFEAMLGPTASMAADVTNIASSFRQGNDPGAQMLNFARNHGIPGANIWWAKAMIDYGMWYSLQEMNNPGYSRRMKRRVERDQEQTFWLSPTTDRLRPLE